MHIHRVKENEDIYSLSREYSIAPETIMAANGIYGVKKPPKDTELLIAVPTRTYNVRRGDTLESIAKRFGTSEEYLKQINPSLRGRREVYPSQILAIKYQDRLFGTCVSNGYLYQGCNIDKLISYLPYLSYITVCGARFAYGKIELLFQDTKIFEINKTAKKRILLRIYAPYIPKSKEERKEFINSSILLAKAHEYDGITISVPNLKEISLNEYNYFISDFKQMCNACSLVLFCEGDLATMPEYIGYSDHTVLTYDKLHLKEIPTFLEGEYTKMQTFADKFDGIRGFIELPSFAFDGRKYIPRDDVARKIIKRRLPVSHDEERKIIRCKSHSAEYLIDSLENTKSKLEAVSELGFMGVSFDIMRTDIRELFLLCQMFAIANLPKAESKLRCDGSEA